MLPSMWFCWKIKHFLLISWLFTENICIFAARMERTESFRIDLKALAQGATERVFNLDDSFFQSLEAAEVKRGCLQTTLVINRTDDYFDLSFYTKGSVVIPCDLCLEDMDQPIETENHLAVKMGESYAEDDDLVTVAEHEGILDVAWFIYEFIELCIPIKHVHAPGKCNPAMIEKLKALSTTRSSDVNGEEAMDPRWAALSQLKFEE